MGMAAGRAVEGVVAGSNHHRDVASGEEKGSKRCSMIDIRNNILRHNKDSAPYTRR